MKRREFLAKSVIAGGILTLGGFGCNLKKESENNKPANDDNCILEPARQIPILAKTDVLVIGGGPAGTAAAIAASRAGAETYLVERYNHLGGLWTGGLVLPLLSTHGTNSKGNKIQVIHGIGGEMAKRLSDMGMAINEVNPVVDPEAAKYVLDEMVSDAGVKVIYHSAGTEAIMDGNTIKGVFIESKSGRQAILAKVVIDCTGDGDVYKWAGEKFDELPYAIGLVHRLGNTNLINKNAVGYRKLEIGSPTPIPGVTWYNMWGEENQCATDVLNLSRLQQKYRKQIWEETEELKKNQDMKRFSFLTQRLN
jgi:Dehydrogenases (flavoproteins)